MNRFNFATNEYGVFGTGKLIQLYRYQPSHHIPRIGRFGKDLYPRRRIHQTVAAQQRLPPAYPCRNIYQQGYGRDEKPHCTRFAQDGKPRG